MADSPTPTLEKTATPITEPVVSDKGTAKPVSESKPQGQTEPNKDAEDSFTSVDIKSLDPKLKSSYDAMLTDYKKKTTEAALMRKDAEARFKEIEDVIKNPEFQKAYHSLTSSQQATVQKETGITEEEFNKAFENKDNFAGFIQKVANISTSQSQQEIVDLKASLYLKDFKSTHPEFDKLNKKGAITLALRADPRAGSNDPKLWEKALNDAYSSVESYHNELLEEGRRQGLERVQQKVAASTEPPTNSPSSVNPFGDPKKWTTAQAIEAARQGYRVSVT